MEQQYKMKYNAAPKPENRFLRIWGPLFIKWGIAFAVTAAAMMIFRCFTFLKESGIDINSIRSIEQFQTMFTKYLLEMSGSVEMMNEFIMEFMKYTTPIEGLAALITIPIMLVMFHKDRKKERMAGFVPNKKAAIWKYAGIIVMSFALTLGVNNLLVISGLSASSETYEETMTALYATPFSIQIICLGILIPICEELVFRGLVFRRLRQTGGFLQSALHSSLIFGFLHGNMVQMLYALFLGMVFCYMYEKYGSVKAPVLAHISANVFSVIMTEKNVMEWLMADPVRMGVITVACASVAATMYVLMQRIEEKPEINHTSENLTVV